MESVPVPVAGALLWAVLLGRRLRQKLRMTGEAPFVLDFELGALLAIGLDAALLRFDGRCASRHHIRHTDAAARPDLG